MNISIVIPNYNGAKLLERNLPIVAARSPDCEIIIVDDGSTDGSIAIIENLKFKIKNYNSKLKIVRNEKNMGFASSVNIGVRQATGNLILLLNTDVVPEKDFLTPLIKHFSDPRVFAVGCLQKCQEDSKVVLRGRGVGKFERGFLLHARGAVSGKGTSEVFEWTPPMVEESKKTLWASGGAGIFRKKIWEKLGGLNPLYNPFYWEDIDLSYRAQKTGYSILFEPKSVVAHNQSQGSIKSIYSSSQIKTIAYRNQIYFVWLNISSLSYLLQHIIFLPIHLLRSIITLDLPFIKALILAIVSLPQVLYHRWRINKYNIKSDKEVLGKYIDSFFVPPKKILR